MNAISRINKQIVNGFIILAVIFSLFPATAPVSSQAPAQPEQIRSDGIRYGSGWNEEIPPTDQSVINLEEQVALQSDPPEESIKLVVESNPAIYLQGKPITLGWVVKGEVVN